MTKLLQNCLLLLSLAVGPAHAQAPKGDAQLSDLLQNSKVQSNRFKEGLANMPTRPSDADLKAAAKTLGVNQPAPENPAAQQVRDASMIVFISLGMPDEDLRYFFNEGRGRKDVVFLLRGAFNDDMQETMVRLAKLANTEKDQVSPNVMILPQAFSNYGIDAVPVLFKQDRKQKDWYKAVGAPSLAVGAKAIDDGTANRVLGKLYPVAERDISLRLKEAASKFDWDKWRTQMTAGWRKKYEEGADLPIAKGDAAYQVDLSITFPADIKDADGKIMVKAGTRVNPLEKTGVPGGAIIVIDVNDVRQRAMARQWLKQYPGAIVMVTRFNEKNVKALGIKVMLVDEITVKRFRLQSVPSLLTEQDKNLLVQAFAPREQGKVALK